MSYINEIEFDFHAGDHFDLSPAAGSYVIGKLLAIGAEFYLDGNAIIVTYVPGEVFAPAEVKPEPVPAPAPAPAPAPVEIPAPVEEVSAPEALSPAEDLAAVEEAVVEAAPVAEVEAPDEVVEAPIKRAPKPQVVTAPKPTKKTVGPKFGEI